MSDKAIKFDVPGPDSPIGISVDPGSSIIFVGANGGGKTRLAARIERHLGERAHRIAAHRALKLNPDVPKIKEEKALRSLHIGGDDKSYSYASREGVKWQHNASIKLLDDYGFLLQALFANQANISLETHKKARYCSSTPAELTKFERLEIIWKSLLPHRTLDISGDDIKVTGSDVPAPYSAADMSDGERAVFYMIGQTLCAPDNCLIIFDEPELHIHRTIMSKLWDALEAARPDCAFALITHDLEFAASRVAQKFVIREYLHPEKWLMEPVPGDSDFPEEIATRILGSRRPILFVEGRGESLDKAIYRSCYPEWTVIPRGSCEEVIHSVVTMRKNAALSRVKCAGIVDADDRDEQELQRLHGYGIAVLPVSEIENILLLPDVARKILEHENYNVDDVTRNLIKLAEKLFSRVSDSVEIERTAARHCRRQIDLKLKRIDFSDCRNADEMQDLLVGISSQINVADIKNRKLDKINQAKSSNDVRLLLKEYDNKGMLADAASVLKNTRMDQFISWLVRALDNGNVNGLLDAIKSYLPTVDTR